MPRPVTLAAVDVGSNAIRLSIASAHGPSELSTLVAERVAIRLGTNTFIHGELEPGVIESTVTAFARFRRLFEEHGVERYRAVATSAVRNANNREDLLDRLYRDVGIQLEVIDGQEEARLVHKAVEIARGDARRASIIVDLGGGSLEINRRTESGWAPASMKIGTVRLLETFGLAGAISEDETRLIRRYVSSQLRANLDLIAPVAGDGAAVACGGNAEALAALFGAPSPKRGVPTLKRSQLEAALPRLLAADVDRRMSRYGIRQDRAEVIGVAGIVFAEVAELLAIKRFEVPGVGIRDGVLLDLAEASVGALAPGDDPVAVASARVFAARLRHNTAHGEQVRRIAKLLFDELRPVHEMPRRLSSVLQVAALLHDLGEVVHRRSHHKHSEYLIANGRIPGLESPERDIAAAVARAHRKSEPSEPKHETFTSLAPEHRDQVRKLAAILRIADGLDADHRQRILAIRASANEAAVTLHITANQPGEPLANAASKAQAFENAFGRRLEIELTVAAPGPESPIPEPRAP
jgi:exopolyphosphatase/guanosine-5'-triphosphate,3'-diphosphate pyrophosphatase